MKPARKATFPAVTSSPLPSRWALGLALLLWTLPPGCGLAEAWAQEDPSALLCLSLQRPDLVPGPETSAGWKV